MNSKIKIGFIEMKFKQFYAILLLVLVAACIFRFASDTEIVYMILGGIMGAFASHNSFFYTEYDPNKKE